MEVSGQLDAPATLLPEQEPPLLKGWMALWAPETVSTHWVKNFLLPGIKTQ